QNSGEHVYLLDMSSGRIQSEFSPANGKNFSYPAVTWLDNTRVYLRAPTIDGPSTGLYLLDSGKGANQTESNLTRVFQSSATGASYPCWDFDSSYSGTQLFVSQCSATHTGTPGPGPDTQLGPSSIG